jgi:hypothetical protein
MSDIDKKYYIPKEEEFCIGFEFEYYNSHVKEYVKAVADAANFSLNNLDGSYDEDYLLSENYSNPNKIRVKYLDKEDIKSLTFTTSDVYNTTEVFTSSLKDLRGQKVKMLYNFTNHWCLIFSGEFGITTWEDKKNQYNMTGNLFAGFLKNKSEFYKILKQLGIK